MRCAISLLCAVGGAHGLQLSGIQLQHSRILSRQKLRHVLPLVHCELKGEKGMAGRIGFALSAEVGKKEGGPVPLSTSVASIVMLYRRASWLSWWGQIILSVVGGVILTFANTVRKGGNTYMLWSSGFAFSSIGALAAVLNAIWTWNMTRMSRRIALGKIEESRIVPTLKRLSQISVTISLVGMAITLIAAEQIVGTLASKVLSSQGLVPTLAIGTQLNQIQALDIFLVQANTNIMAAHYLPCAVYVWLGSIRGGAEKTPTPRNVGGSS